MTDPETKEFKYLALAVTQRPGAPTMYLLGVTAANLLEWSDVPNAKGDYMAGYQRVYSAERAAAITEFIGLSEENIVPGAVIVTAKSDSVSVARTSHSDLVEITVSLRVIPFETRLAQTLEGFESRLGDQERISISSASPDDLEAADIATNADADEDPSTPSGLPESYLAVLTAELRQAVKDFGSLPPGRQSAIRNYIESISKPGLIIDGQHRVFGAKDVQEFDVQLPVVLIPGLPMREQVFHFYVLNNKAKPLSPTELRRTISTSLTDAEIDQLWDRFEKAGVDPEATRWTHKVDTDPRSPFRGLLDFGLGGAGFIKENVMYQVVSAFVNMPRKYRLLHKDVPAFQAGSDERLTYFFAFWGAIRERYQAVWDAAVTNRGGQLLYKASLLVLQEYLLDFMVQLMNVRAIDGKPSPFADLDDLRSVVKAALRNLPPEFFSTEWQEKQIDTSVGRGMLREQVDTAVRNQGKFLGNQSLFRRT